MAVDLNEHDRKKKMAQAKWKRSAKGKSAGRRAQLKRCYGITPEQYDWMFTQQKGLCAICRHVETNTRKTVLSVDHNHATQKLRGLLCNSCNRALGLFQDSVTTLQTAIDYLKQYSGEKQ